MNQRLPIRENKTVVFLAALLVLLVSTAIGQSGWTQGLGIVLYVGLGAVIIGLLTSRSLLPGLIAHLFSAIIGLGWSFWVVAQLLPENFSYELRWLTLQGRVIEWFVKAQQGGIIYDNLVFILQMSFVVWIFGYLTMWFLFRSGRIWGAIIPTGVVLLVNLYYAPNDLTGWFISYLLLALLLLVRYNLFEYEQRWRAEQIHFRPDISFDFLRNGLIFSVVVIAVAWFTPVVSADSATTFFSRFDRQWRGVQTEWNRLFAGLNYKPQTSSNPNAYAQTHALGGSRQLTEQLVMYVNAPGGRYWRASVYDNYDGNTWQSNDQAEVRFSGETPAVSLPLYEARTPFTQTYTTLQEGLFILYAMAHPVAINRPTVAKTSFLSSDQLGDTVQWPSGQEQPKGEELTYIESDARLKFGDTYQVVSMQSAATKEQLRNDHVNYPDWIRDRYLAIPESTTERTKALARDLTANRDTPFEKAEAIERFMRNQITYNELISAPPPGRDKVDYILFEAQEAYCDYYATSMIVMLRSLGIPARFAAGFAQGAADTLEGEGFQEEVYMVRNLDAHSWVEVYFPSYGWIEFEPTAAQPVIVRRTDSPTPFRNPGRPDEFFEEDPFQDLNDLLGEEAPNFDDIVQPTQNTYNFSLPLLGDVQAPKATVNWSLAGLLVLVIGFMGYRVTQRQNFGQDDMHLTNEIYVALLRIAGWMGLGKHPSQTPYEHAEVIAQTLPPVKEEVTLIADAYVHQKFSPRNISEANKSRVLDAWDNIRPKLYRAVFDRRKPKIRLPFKW